MITVVHLGYQIMILANYGFMVDDVDSKEGKSFLLESSFPINLKETELVENMKILHFQVQCEEVDKFCVGYDE